MRRANFFAVCSRLPLLTAATLLGSCAAGMSPAARQAPPASPAEGRNEMAQLERQITVSRASLGLPPRARAKDSAEADASAGEQVEAQAMSPPAPSREPAEERHAEKSTAGGAAEVTSKHDACAVDPCRYTKAICNAAARICDIARYLGDDDARGRCGRAQQDCAEARRATRDSCPGC